MGRRLSRRPENLLTANEQDIAISGRHVEELDLQKAYDKYRAVCHIARSVAGLCLNQPTERSKRSLCVYDSLTHKHRQEYFRAYAAAIAANKEANEGE